MVKPTVSMRSSPILSVQLVHVMNIEHVPVCAGLFLLISSDGNDNPAGIPGMTYGPTDLSKWNWHFAFSLLFFKWYVLGIVFFACDFWARRYSFVSNTVCADLELFRCLEFRGLLELNGRGEVVVILGRIAAFSNLFAVVGKYC